MIAVAAVQGADGSEIEPTAIPGGRRLPGMCGELAMLVKFNI
jgi:hypothetical protein